jgi:hypothetical protein
VVKAVKWIPQIGLLALVFAVTWLYRNTVNADKMQMIKNYYTPTVLLRTLKYVTKIFTHSIVANIPYIFIYSLTRKPCMFRV